MKMKKRMLIGLLSLSGSVLAFSGLQAQTTLTGDHIVTGSLEVQQGVSMGGVDNRGNMNVGGSIYTNGDFLSEGQWGQLHWDSYYGTLAGGWWTTAPGYYAFAFGEEAEASGAYAVAFGDSAIAGGEYSFSSGWASEANGFSSIAIGTFVEANGAGSLAIGDSCTSDGMGSQAFGFFSNAKSRACAVFGQYNKVLGTEEPVEWVETDPLFVVGNGIDYETPSNAFVIFKNGNIQIPKRQGDILMGEFGNPE